MWNNSASCGPPVAAHRLPTNRARNESGDALNHPPDVCADQSQSSGFLSARSYLRGRVRGTARPGAARGAGVADLWQPEDRGGVASWRPVGQSQTGAAADAGRQPALFAETQVCDDDRLRPRVARISKPGGGAGGERNQPALEIG